jgi:hypothetical protein
MPLYLRVVLLIAFSLPEEQLNDEFPASRVGFSPRKLTSNIVSFSLRSLYALYAGPELPAPSLSFTGPKSDWAAHKVECVACVCVGFPVWCETKVLSVLMTILMVNEIICSCQVNNTSLTAPVETVGTCCCDALAANCIPPRLR